MNLDDLIRSLTPEVYENLKNAVATGRWPNGRKLEDGQRELCMEAIIWYENTNNVPEEQRTGYIDLGSKANKAGKKDDGPDEQILTIK